MDEPVQGRTFIYIVSLGDNLNANARSERKIEDWTGLCKANDPTGDWKQMNCMLDKKDVLYLSTHNAIHAVLLSSLETQNVAGGQVLAVGPNPCKGVAKFDDPMRHADYSHITNHRLLCMYDTEESFNKD